MFVAALQIIAVLLVALYVCIWARIAPVVVMRVWFGIVMFNVLLLTNGLTFLADSLKLVGASAKTTQLLCTYICVVTFRAAIFFNPHIRVRIEDRRQRWADVPEPSAMALNHTSFWDAFVFVGSAPVNYIYNCRTLMKASLRKMPIFGPVYDRVGHFPVYFKSGADGDFSVDKDRQAEVSVRVAKHIDDGGRIALFPEGAVNKTPAILKSFRHGSFVTILQHRMKLYYCLMVGNDESWPSDASIGGYPADIDVVIGKFEFSHDHEDAKTLAAKLQDAMQRDLDDIRSRRAKEGRSKA